jgi:hypothetical protein
VVPGVIFAFEMVPAATLKVFEPLAAFDANERAYWERYVAGGTVPPSDVLLLSREHGLRGETATLLVKNEHADAIERRGTMFVCPHRTKLRLLASLLTFRRSIPAEVVPSFMPDDEVERAADGIEALRTAHPTWRNHVLESAWEVPLHWFVPFDDAEREVVESAGPSIRYETIVRAASERSARALEIVREMLPNPGIIAPVAGLARWLEEFDPSGVLVLDYEGVGGLFPEEELRRDRTAHEIWASIGALAEGDGDRASAHYMVAAERWAGVRRRETWN